MKKILIIEDDQIVANIYRNKLSLDGFEAEVALDGETGLQLLPNFRPDVILLDLMLPKMSGIDVMKQIRAEADFELTPIIVFSNTYLSNMVQEAWKAGATKCLSKANCTPKQVIEVVRSIAPNGDKSQTVKSKKQSPAPAKAAAQADEKKTPGSDADAAFQTELRQSFVESFPATLAALRTHLQALVKSDSEENRLSQLHELYRKTHGVTGNAGLAGMNGMSHLADALEVLLKELREKPKNINASTLRTIANAIDFMGQLFQRGEPANEEVPPAKILVVDDEALSRRAITYALEKAKLQSTNVEDPLAALKMLTNEPFNLVFLDVDMPGMNGFELCAKLRTLPAHKKTPVIFVTSLNDLESRTNSSMSGGNDFIAKPFLFIELAVKALVYVLRSRFETPKPAAVTA